ncbi:AAA family ATPase [Ornithinibacillus contaminans]|uniref:AAA family ATPase n=1 Tax=Ornithinibacillus contaminans TaxID=694055 RepID=UPI00064D91BC|nr:AAA family ATPase [Ornithinibacillus contaminans]
MRAITLSLTAFGPYLEKQIIRFDELGDESIFLITGPTGAGKTTIFDAICYALYGKASGSDRDQDSLRSHFATDAEPTEVTFRFSLTNKIYEITRNPKQLKKKERGDGYTEEPAKAVLYEVNDGQKQLLSSRIKDVNETIEERLGFDYEQFRKMVLIPQGEFRKLISENSREREVILQKIFRTYFYEQITEALKMEAKDMEAAIRKLETDITYEISKVQWRNEEVEETDSVEEVRNRLVQENEDTKQLIEVATQKKLIQQEKIKHAEEKLHQAKLIEEKFSEQELLTTQLEKLERDRDQIEQKKATLKNAQQAQHIIPLEEQRIAREKEWQHQLSRLTKQQEHVTQLEKLFTNISVQYSTAADKEQEREQLKEDIKAAKKQLEQVNHYLELKQQADRLQKKKHQDEVILSEVEKHLATNEQTLVAIETNLSEESSLTKAFYETKDTLNKQAELNRKLKELRDESRLLVQLRQEFSVIHRTYQEKQNEIKQLRIQYDSLAVKQKEQYASLLAHQLIPGEPCPVCGSKDHPAVATTMTVEEDHQQMKQLKSLLEQKEQEFEAFQQQYIDSKTTGQSKRDQVVNLQQQLAEIAPDMNAEEMDKLEVETERQLDQLQQDQKEIADKLSKLNTLKEQKETLKQKETELKQTFEQTTKSIQQTQEAFVQIRTQIEETKKLLPEELEDPTTFVQLVNRKERHYEQLLSEWEQLKGSYETARDSLHKERTVLEQLTEFEKETKQRYEHQLEQFIAEVKTNGFDSVESYEHAKLSLEEQKQLEALLQEYENKTKQLRYRLQELTEQLAKLERVNLVELEVEIGQFQLELQAIQDNLFALTAKLKHDEIILSQLTSTIKQLKTLEKEYYTVGKLADLSSGNNSLRLSFERYVLASFLDEILLQANIRLDRMTEHRYQLIRSGEIAKRGAQSGLDLEVMDHHTGIRRSVKTLSGGEGFKAALSLALGLADVVQAHAGGVQLDTLFIDEGFGTLDEVSLQQAINCLKDLQESNRLLGIISHVPQLKNEIHTKLMITPSHRGSSLTFSFGK